MQYFDVQYFVFEVRYFWCSYNIPAHWLAVVHWAYWAVTTYDWRLLPVICDQCHPSTWLIIMMMMMKKKMMMMMLTVVIIGCDFD